MWRILIVDDDQKYRKMLRENLERAGHWVCETGQGELAVGAAETQCPQIILLDFDLPDASGSTICRRLKANANTSSIPVVIVTANAGEGSRVESLKAGADDYLSKPFSFRELVARIRALVEGASRRGVGVYSVGKLAVDLDNHWLRVNGEPTAVSRAELALLRCLCREPRRLWTRAELVDSIWGLETEADGRVVDALVRRLCEKLGSAADYIRAERDVGYRLVNAIELQVGTT